MQNHGGKDVISIAASLGLKTLHAITQAYNESIADDSNIKDLWFNVEILDPFNDENSKHYNFLADAYLDIKTNLPIEEQREELKMRLLRKGLTNEQIEVLWNTYVNHSEWAGSNESGILTLATDNAKELRLDRLNAGVDLAGLYLYGIIIGMPREEIFRIMTSQTAQALARLTKGNLFTEPHRFLDKLTEAIKFLKGNPNLPKTIIAKDKIERIEKLTPIEGITYDGKNLNTFLTLPGESLRDTIAEITRRGQFKTYLERLKLLQQRIQTNEFAVKMDDITYKNPKKRRNGLSYDERQERNTVLRLIEYATAINEIVDSHLKKQETTEAIHGNPWAHLENIETLSRGEQELSNVNQLLGLNQGQKTKTEDVYKFYERFSTILSRKLQAEGKMSRGKLTKQAIAELEHIAGPDLIESNGRVDFHKFNSDPDYQQRVINTYQQVCTTINVPHFKQYLGAAHMIYLESRISIKNRTMIDQIVPHIYKVFKPNATEVGQYYKRALNFIDGLMSNAFLREDMQIIIPAGNKIYKKGSDAEKFNYEVYDYPVPIELGTREGNETFRTWMNQSVIPGLIREGKLYDQSVKARPTNILINGPAGNSFLRDLITTNSNNTPNRNNIMIYTLPIDMIPKSDTEIDQLSKYTIDFYRLKNYKYKVSDDVGYTLTDLFFYYNLINFQNRGGAASLTALFEQFVKSGEPSASNRYIKFISNLDTEYNFKMGRDYTEDMLNIALAPNTQEITMTEAEDRKIPYLYATNKFTLKQEIHRYNPEAIKQKKEFLSELDIEVNRN